MHSSISKLFGAACVLAVCSLVSFYFGAQSAAGVASAHHDPADLSRQFAADPGDGLMLLGGLLLIVALALASAALMLWRHERG